MGEGKKDGRCHLSYTLKATDKKHLQSAVEHAARILVAAGAREVHSAHNVVEPLCVGGAEGDAEQQRPELEAWLARLRSAGMPELGVALGSAHQMSTCRMAADPRVGAVKPSGETWEVAGLFVADTSTFPTASGVNPMWTCAALAHRVAQQVKQHLAATPALTEPRPTAQRRRLGCVAACATLPRPSPHPKKAQGFSSAETSTESTSASSGSDLASIRSATSSTSEA